MKIGIALYHTNPNSIKGLTVYTLSLLEGFINVDKKNEYLLLVRPEDEKSFLKYEKLNFKIKPINGFSNKFRRKISYFLNNYIFIFPILRIFYSLIDKIFNTDIIHEVDALKLDIVYFPSGALFPININTTSAVSIHDIQYDHFPRFFNIFERFGRETAHKATVEKVAFIQASSEFSKKDFIRYFRTNPKKFVVIRDGVSKVFNSNYLIIKEKEEMRNKYKLPEQFVFYPAQHWQHKNHLTLLKAILQLKKEGLKIPIVLTGSLKTKGVNLVADSEKLGIRNLVTFLGNIPFEDILKIYKLARIVCIPSLHESNSLPLMEALISGTATLASDIEPNVEINSAGAITIFKQLDNIDLAEKMKNLFEENDLREEKVKKGLEIARNYSWENTAKNYIQVFEKTINMLR